MQGETSNIERHDSEHTYNSFNLTMEEEHKKIRRRTEYIRSDPVKNDSKELIPCDFLRYVANVQDDLEQLAYQLNANHADNFPTELVAK